MIGWLAAGTLAFVLFVLSDLRKAVGGASGPLFAAGALLLAGGTAGLLLPLHGAISVLRVLSGAWALLWMLAEVYVLFFALPAGDTYGTADIAVCSAGVYALCRHPGGWCLAMFYLGLWGLAGTTSMLTGAILFSLLNFVYIFIQDRWLFPRYIAGYSDYQKKIPFLLPTHVSLAACRGKR